MRILGLLIALVFFLAPLPAHADVTGATFSPSNVSIPIRGGAVNVTWSVTTSGGAGGGTFNVASTTATLRSGGRDILTLAGNLSRTVTLGAGEITTLTFSETYTISPAQAREISRYGAGSLNIRRLFTDGGGTVVPLIPVSTGNAGPLSVRRIALQFENQSRTDIVQQGDTLRAVADVSFRSNGLLRGEWRLVNPSSSLGEARGRVLQVVRQQLVSSGEGRTRIVSPPLPTDVNGLHLLSFSVEDTDGNIEVPILRYFVLEGRDNVSAVNMSVLTPGEGALVNSDTVFSWASLEGAQAYQVEILESGTDDVVTAKLVPGTDLKLSLSALSFEDLVAGQSYDWRIQGFAAGKAIGQSKRQSIKIQ